MIKALLTLSLITPYLTAVPVVDDVLKESKAESAIKINLELDQSPVDPSEPGVIDPNNPGGDLKPLDPNSPGGGGTGDKSFYINWASDFKFETIMLGDTTESFAKKETLQFKDGSKVESYPFLQITNRQSTPFEVSVKASPLSSSEGELQGATLSILKGNIFRSDLVDSSNLPQFQQVNNLLTGNEVSILKGDGLSNGVFTTVFENNGSSSVKISLAKNKPYKASSYTGNLTWVLKQTP